MEELQMKDVKFQTLKVRDKVEGTVFKVEDNVIYLTLENFEEGRMFVEFYGKNITSFKDVVKEGDKVTAIITKMNDEPSYILLSRLPLLKDESFKVIEDAYKDNKTIETKITKVDEKGLHLKYEGFDIFLPYGLLDRELVESKDTLKGQTLEVHLIEVKNGKRPRLIASRKQIFEARRQQELEERQNARKEEIDQINTGDVLKGTIERIEPHAATVRFNHVAGLLRISQIQHRRIEDINEVIKLGDEIEVKVIKKEGMRLDLSHKALLPTPFEAFSEEHKKGSAVKGAVVQKLPFGLIIELEEGVRGLLHQSEYSWNPNDNFANFVKIGDVVESAVLLVDVKKKKISLSRKALFDNPWKNVSFKRGENVEVKVIEIITDKGMNVEAKGVVGFIPVSELSTERVNKIEDLFAVGDTMQARVIDVNPKEWYLKLSVKQIAEDSLRSEYEQYLTHDEEATTTIGDLFENLLTEKDKK
ncbi:MAG: S1 RNA-binding domain-containing protein [Paracholeplasma sp.]|nr:S1 RNA-binding domain-containing protein [Paracholeplasma sp.]MDY3195907.1 S1 RNA-binding domain-containing protein [Paracholeplasma sp.]